MSNKGENMLNFFKKSKEEKLNETENETENSETENSSNAKVEVSPVEVIEQKEQTANIVFDKEAEYMSSAAINNGAIKTEEPEDTPQPLTQRELKYLKRANYDELIKKCTKAYLLKNIKTNQMAEIRAFSSFHACNILGWKNTQVRIIEEKEVEPIKEENK